MSKMNFDVAIIGGGPAGSIVASLLKRYDPSLSVAIFERERFPRDHVGESLLPSACIILHEAGVWEKVEAANFPVKVGAVYRWGQTPELIQFEFLPGETLEGYSRPAPFDRARAGMAFQVDRSVFDSILLGHAEDLGCTVYQESKVTRVNVAEDHVVGIETKISGTETELITARYYVDASGVGAILRRAFSVPVESPTRLRNIAIWDYWQDCVWPSRVGVDGTHIQVLSVGWGWLWFIAIGASRTSVGLVTPASYFKQSGLSREEIYLKGIAEQPRICELVKDGTRENRLSADRDWSYLAERICGENWFLAGDSCGFADPILSAGISLALTGARKVAYSILALEEGSLDTAWIKSEYERTHTRNIRNHIRFADYWYSANTKFTDLQEYCSEIARSSGLNLDANEAFRWIGTGGFVDDVITDIPYAGSYRLSEIKKAILRFSGQEPEWIAAKYGRFRLNLDGAERVTVARYFDGKMIPCDGYKKGDQVLVVHGLYKIAVVALGVEHVAVKVLEYMKKAIKRHSPLSDKETFILAMEVLEAMVVAGWIEVSEAILAGPSGLQG
jgi:flavin-dependent dehydrogenase